MSMASLGVPSDSACLTLMQHNLSSHVRLDDKVTDGHDVDV